MVPRPLPIHGEIVAGKYQIDAVLGRGGMGVVMSAIDQSLGRPVAIKFLSPTGGLSSAAATRFDREARAAASIQSDHVVRVYEVGALPSGAPFIVMEHLRGSDLSEVLQQRGGLPIDYACDLLLQTCEALGDAHARGIVHRDLKPQNLFLTQRNDGTPCVKVLDFGISKVAEDESSPKLTSTDMVMGTPLYMSPEQVRSLKNVDARADIWALGAILHELLAASPPFDGPSASALHAAIAMDAPAPIRTRRPDLPPGLEGAILRCLEKDPARRFQSVHELADALMPFATERGRQSARNIVRLAPPSDPSLLPPPAGGFGTAPTLDVRSQPSRMGSLSGPPNGATDTSWQQSSAQRPPLPKPASNGAIIGALAAGGVALLLAGGAFAAFFLARGSATQTISVAAATAPSSIPVPAMTPSAAAPPSAPTQAPTPAPAPAPAPKAKDAGPPTPAPPTKDEQLAARAKQAQSMCDHHEFMMGPSQSEASRRSGAETAKMLTCNRGPDSPRCERNVCTKACTILNDQMCLRMAADTDRMSPAKY